MLVDIVYLIDALLVVYIGVYCIVRGQQTSSGDLNIAESVSEIKLSSFEL